MRKLFTVLATLLLTVAAYAQQPSGVTFGAKASVQRVAALADLQYEVEPSTQLTDLSELTEITLSGMNFTIQDYEKVTIQKDGAYFCGVESRAGRDLYLAPTQRVAGPCVASLHFAEGAAKINDTAEDTPEFSISWTLVGNEAVGGAAIVADPKDGDVVESLKTVMIKPASSSIDYIDLSGSASDINVTKDGVDFTTVRAAEYYPGYRLTLAQEATEAGEYKIIVPAATFVDSNDQDVPAFTLTYTIEAVPEPLEIKVSPEPGNLTEALTTITIASGDSNYPLIDIVSASDITVTKDGDAWSGVTYELTAAGAKLTLSTPGNESGVYKVNIPADSYEIYKWASSGDGIETRATENLEYTYDVEVGGPRYTIGILPTQITPNSVPTEDEPERSVDLAAYENGLTEFSFRLTEKEGYYAIPGAKATVVCKKNKYSVEAEITSDKPSSFIGKQRTTFHVTLPTAIVQNGTYTLSIPRGAFGNEAYSQDQNTGIANKAFTTEVKFTGGEPEPEPTVVYDLDIIRTNPKAGVLDLSSYTWGVTNISISSAYDIREGAEITMTGNKGSYNLTAKLRQSMLTADVRTVKYICDEPRNNGTYTLTIPQGTFGDAEWLEDPEAGHSNPEIKVVWLVAGAAGTIADYDLTVESTAPAADGTADISENPLAITVTAEGELNFVPGIVGTLVNAESNYSGTVAFTSAQTADGKTVFTAKVSPEVTYDGTYTLTLPQGMFGDLEYVEDCSQGHGNAAYTMNFSVTGGIPAKAPIVYDLEPVVTPANESETTFDEIKRITFVFPAGTNWTEENTARASLSCPAANYFDTALFRRGETSGSFYLNFGTKPFREGTYTLVLNKGIFVDEALEHANPEITYTWTVKSAGIDSVTEDAYVEGGVYNLNGVYVGESLENLPAGIYVVKGRKVITNK